MYRVTYLQFLMLGALSAGACSESEACPTEGAIRLNGVCDCPSSHPRYESAGDRCVADESADLSNTDDVQGDGGTDSGVMTAASGDASMTSELPPTQNAETPTVQLAAGGIHSCRAVGASLSCWGANVYGEVGPGMASPQVLRAIPGLVDPMRVSLGFHYSCALLKDTSVACWGNNESGQLGDRTRTSRADPRPVPELSNVVELSAGYEHACVRLATGDVQCWGRNIVGQLGDGTDLTRTSPVLVGGLSNVVEVAAGGSHTCARHASGTVSCWGANHAGQLGDGTTTDRGTPLEVPGLTGVTRLSLGGEHSCALLSSGQVSCWGRNMEGQLGDTTTTSRSTPAVVIGLSGVVELASGRGHVCVRRASGQVACWGSNAAGELGTGVNATTLPLSKSPLDVVGLNDALVVVAGSDHTCAVRPKSVIECWGENTSQQLGDGSNTRRSVPTRVREGL